MQIEFILRGTSPLLCHNPQMVDPECEFAREIKKISGKKKKTDEDHNEIAKLEWMGGLYTAAVGGRTVVSQPSSKVRKCLINAARITRQGKEIERSLIMTQLHVPLIYEGCEKAGDPEAEIDRLLADASFHSRLSVGIGAKRVMRTRPSFLPWALVVPAVFLTDAGMNFDQLQNLIDLAGRAERIGDNRVNGYGSFMGYVREVTPGSRPIDPTLAGVEKFVTSRTGEKEAR